MITHQQVMSQYANPRLLLGQVNLKDRTQQPLDQSLLFGQQPSSEFYKYVCLEFLLTKNDCEYHHLYKVRTRKKK